MNGGKAVFKRNFCDSLPVSEHHVVSHETAACAFARMASSNASSRSSMPLSSREKTSTPRAEADVRIFSRASACPGNEGFQRQRFLSSL